MGCVISWAAGMALSWCNMAVIIFHSPRQRRNTLSNVKSDQRCGKPHWWREPICHICSVWHHTSPSNIHYCPDWPSLGVKKWTDWLQRPNHYTYFLFRFMIEPIPAQDSNDFHFQTKAVKMTWLQRQKWDILADTKQGKNIHPFVFC